MKVNALTGFSRFLELARGSRSEDSDSQSSPQYSPPQQDDSEQKSPDDPEKREKKLSEAIDSFSHDAQAQANGLSVERVGSGPGLRVVLKDGSGSVVRQFTGEEFLDLRQGTTRDGRSSGKILDKKL